MKRIVLLVCLLVAMICGNSHAWIMFGFSGGKRVTVSVDGTWQGDYAAGTTYASDDIVASAGTNYKSLQDGNVGHTPASSPTYWQAILVKGDAGAAGAAGADGADGASSYTYVAYASDASGTDFTTAFDADLDYVAIKVSATEIAAPAASDFTGLWKNYKGATGATGPQGPAGDGSGDMLKSENLSGLANAATARTNIGLGSASDVTHSTLTLAGAGGLDLGVAGSVQGDIGFYSNTAENTYHAHIIGANFTESYSLRLPVSYPAGANYLLNVDADGTMGYTDPSTLGGASVSNTAYDATSWDSVTTDAPSKNAIRDYLESKMPSGSDGTYGAIFTNNTTRSPTASTDEVYFEANIFKVNQNGTESTVPIGPTAGQITFTGPTQARSYTLPDAAGTLATLAGTETLSNKTLTAPNIGAATGSSLSLSGNLTGLAPAVILTHASGVHDGSNDAAIMTDSGESFTTSSMVGMTVYNITGGSSCTVTANNGTTITCTLAGGTGNDWDTNDVWQVGPGPNQSGSIFYVSAASTIRHPTTTGYAAGYYVDGAVVLTVDVASGMTITNATAAAVDAGDTIDSPATAGSFVYLHNKSATAAMSMGKNGTWTDGGAN